MIELINEMIIEWKNEMNKMLMKQIEMNEMNEKNEWMKETNEQN